MFTLMAFFSMAGVHEGLVGMMLFWLLTAFVIWGFVDLLATPSRKFESVNQTLALWVLAYAFFGPVASGVWCAMRARVKSAPDPPPLVPPPSPQTYPYPQVPYVPPHLERDGTDDEAPPPLR